MDKRCRASLLGVVWGLILSLPVAGYSAEKPLLPGEKAFKSDSPVNIASDRMETNQTDRTILFEGHVIVKQDDLTITGQRMRVYAAAEAAKGPDKGAQKAPEKGADQSPAMMQKIDRIEIEGD
ncbi:MAG: LptA/OstA family protein, partial [Acidobacteriota bacterium]